MAEIHTLKEPQRLYREAKPIEYLVGPQTGCWNVVSHKPMPDGYIQIRRNGQQTRAHRYSWELIHGRIPDRFYVCHHCDNPICINPDHLFLGTQCENMQDAMQKGRLAHPNGETNANSKLTEADVRAIRADTISMGSTLGRKYGVSPQQISRIKRDKTWRHV